MRHKTDLRAGLYSRRDTSVAQRKGVEKYLLFGAILLLGLAVSVLTVLGGQSQRVLFLASGAALLPLAVYVTSRWPSFALAAIIAVQPLEAFEINTPVVSVSLGMLLLVPLLFLASKKVLDWARADRRGRAVAVMLIGWVTLIPLRAIHTDFPEVMRLMVTTMGFLAFGAAGIAISKDRKALGHVAWGATVALVALGVFGVLASKGIIPPPDRIGPPRALFGITSPLLRNYGLDVPWDAVAALVPLAVPYHVLRCLRSNGRFPAMVAFGAIALSVFYVFQARGMILQIIVAVVGAIWLTRPLLRPVLLIASIPFLFLITASLLEVDTTSTDARAVSYTQALAEIEDDPGRFVLGVNEDAFVRRGVVQLGVGRTYFESLNTNLVHNFLLSNLVAGGYLAFGLLVASLAVIGHRAFINWYSRPRNFEAQVLLVGIGLVLITLTMEPARAGIVGIWVFIGLVLGATAPVAHRGAGA